LFLGLAETDHRSLSSAIELILTDYLEKHHEFPRQRERRHWFVHKQKGVIGDFIMKGFTLNDVFVFPFSITNLETASEQSDGREQASESLSGHPGCLSSFQGVTR
jgi:hypothetical protein